MTQVQALMMDLDSGGELNILEQLALVPTILTLVRVCRQISSRMPSVLSEP
jgi:hypothetical protein